MNTVSLNAFQTEAYLEIVAASLDITRRTHFFSWLQGAFQALIPHEIMVCGIRTGEGDHIQFDHFSSTRYFTDTHLEEATRANHGLIWRAMAAWTKTQKPTFIAQDLEKGEYLFHSVPFVEEEGSLQKAELKNMATYGVNGHAGVSSFFCFSRVNAPLDAQCAYFLQLLVPHLHVILTRLMLTSVKPIQAADGAVHTITGREAEILQWVHEGKTNQSIADHLGISALTVKNHVQSILRKLDVQNRSHAAVKALNLGLIKPTKSRSKSNPKSNIKPKNKPQKKGRLHEKAYADVVISAAQITSAIAVNTAPLSEDEIINNVAHYKAGAEKSHGKNQAKKQAKTTSHKKTRIDRLLSQSLPETDLANPEVALTPAELIEKMRMEERIKRQNRIAIRRKMLIAKGLLGKQAKGNTQIS